MVFGNVISENFIFTFNYLFDTIKETTKKFDMVIYTIHILYLLYLAT